MSVLVEILSVVIPRRILEVRHPGGVRAYLDVAGDESWGARWACADEHLTSVSFVSRADVERLVRVLTGLGIVHAGADRAADVALVDEHEGPNAPCQWLEWGRHEDGYAHCWLAGTEPGALCAPRGWEPARTRAMHGDATDGKMRLAKENGIEIWLDFATGRLTAVARGDQTATTPPTADTAREEIAMEWERHDGGEGRIMSALLRALAEREWTYTVADGGGAVVWSVSGEGATYRVAAIVDERQEQLACYVICPNKVPSERRPAASEVLTRANYGLRLGNFEMDFDDGEVRFKTSIDVEGGELTPLMVHTMLAAGLGTVERYYGALMRVVYGGAPPADAVREAEGR